MGPTGELFKDARPVWRNGFKSAIRKNNHAITVPSVTWKVALILESDGTPRLLGVIVPNNTTPGLEWAGYRVPVKEIEELTGFKFFDKSHVPNLEALKEEVDEVPIRPPALVQHDS